MADEMVIEVLRDGSIKTTTGPVSPANHSNAEGFLREMARTLGGETTREARHGHGALEHEHEHEGEHEH